MFFNSFKCGYEQLILVFKWTTTDRMPTQRRPKSPPEKAPLSTAQTFDTAPESEFYDAFEAQ